MIASTLLRHWNHVTCLDVVVFCVRCVQGHRYSRDRQKEKALLVTLFAMTSDPVTIVRPSSRIRLKIIWFDFGRGLSFSDSILVQLHCELLIRVPKAPLCQRRSVRSVKIVGTCTQLASNILTFIKIWQSNFDNCQVPNRGRVMLRTRRMTCQRKWRSLSLENSEFLARNVFFWQQFSYLLISKVTYLLMSHFLWT